MEGEPIIEGDEQKKEEESKAEAKRESEMFYQSMRADKLGEIANLNGDLESINNNIDNTEDSTIKDRFIEEARLLKEKIKQKQDEYDEWDRIERTGSPN